MSIQHRTQLVERDEAAAVLIRQLKQGQGQIVEDVVTDLHAALSDAVLEDCLQLGDVNGATAWRVETRNKILTSLGEKSPYTLVRLHSYYLMDGVIDGCKILKLRMSLC